VAKDLPPELGELTERQRGMLTRAQVLQAGFSRSAIAERLNRGSWQRMHPGVYATFSGEPNREAMLWAAVLDAGPGAMLSHQTAAELDRLADTPSSLIHLTLPGDRRVRKRPGLVLHRSARASQAVHPARTPPRTRVEETVIDLWDAAGSIDDAVSWVARSLGRRLTTQAKLRAAVDARAKVRSRALLDDLLCADMDGLNSILEYRYVRDVERPHGFPKGTRQAIAARGGRRIYRDTVYEKYELVVELDGRISHPDEFRWDDVGRDNAAAADGLTTLRYGTVALSTAPCEVAAEVAKLLVARGYAGTHPCSPGCPVGR
jgi:Transcriptional regulator, AbiEi antitoxin